MMDVIHDYLDIPEDIKKMSKEELEAEILRLEEEIIKNRKPIIPRERHPKLKPIGVMHYEAKKID